MYRGGMTEGSGQVGLREIAHGPLTRVLERGEVVLVDVLPAASFERAHLPGARSLPLEELEARAATVLPAQNAPLVVYCASPT